MVQCAARKGPQNIIGENIQTVKNYFTQFVKFYIDYDHLHLMTISNDRHTPSVSLNMTISASVKTRLIRLKNPIIHLSNLFFLCLCSLLCLPRISCQ